MFRKEITYVQDKSVTVARGVGRESTYNWAQGILGDDGNILILD